MPKMDSFPNVMCIVLCVRDINVCDVYFVCDIYSVGGVCCVCNVYCVHVLYDVCV